MLSWNFHIPAANSSNNLRLSDTNPIWDIWCKDEESFSGCVDVEVLAKTEKIVLFLSAREGLLIVGFLFFSIQRVEGGFNCQNNNPLSGDDYVFTKCHAMTPKPSPPTQWGSSVQGN